MVSVGDAAIWCAHSYLNESEIVKMYPECKVIREVRESRGCATTIRAFAHRRGNRLCIVFKGTSSIRDALLDLQMTTTEFKDIDGRYVGDVHCGFAKIFDKLKCHIYSLIGVHTCVVLTGHSLGGALALMTLAWISPRVSDVRACVFGCPRIGNVTFSNHFTSQSLAYSVARSVMVQNELDPVLCMPNRVEFDHVLPFRVLSLCKCPTETPKCEPSEHVIVRIARAIIRELSLHLGHLNLREHQIDTYVLRLHSVTDHIP